MAGGLIQLLAWGSQNIKLNGNPSITFFKKILKSHSNFSMESIRVELSRTTANVLNNTIFKGKLKRHGDLVQQVYFVFELPDIKANALDFAWVQNIGEACIDNYHVNIGGVMADRQYGEFLHIMNELGLSIDQKAIYNKMIGNVSQLYDPKDALGMYPSNSPVIASRKIYVPLNFWFNKDSGSSLPLLCLQYSETEITIEMRPLVHLYKVLGKAPNRSSTEEQLVNFIHEAVKRYIISNEVIDIRAYLEVNYYFVDSKEREAIAFNTHEYLIEQTTRIERFGLSSTNIYELVLQNPVKEIVWVLKRNDISSTTNNWFNFMDEGRHILSTAKFIFNGMDRIDEKDAAYFNYLQAWQHHNGSSKDGIYVYSFSITPDDISQPSGSCNMSRINKIQVMMNVVSPLARTYGYDMTMYVISYNFLKISSGLAGIVFSA